MSLSLPSLVANLTSSLESSIAIVPGGNAILPQDNGLSLLDMKNECFLSYLQNLTFMVILKIRHANCNKIVGNDYSEKQETYDLEQDVTRKLVEVRHYVEKGVLPLESRMKYQLDKVLRAANQPSVEEKDSRTKRKSNKIRLTNGDVGSETSETEDLKDDDIKSIQSRGPSPEIDELSYRPNPSALLGSNQSAALANSSDRITERASGIYRPPKVTPTAYPKTTTVERERRDNRKMRSAVLDEFVTNELSTAPAPLPSIGSAIDARGRRNKSTAERAAEAERAAYEEENFIRLPQESKKKRAQLAKSRSRENGYGGEEWRLLGNDVDRIQKVTRARDRDNMLERSRKRQRISTEQPSGDVGAEFARRKKAVMKSLKRKGKS